MLSPCSFVELSCHSPPTAESQLLLSLYQDSRRLWITTDFYHMSRILACRLYHMCGTSLPWKPVRTRNPVCPLNLTGLKDLSLQSSTTLPVVNRVYPCYSGNWREQKGIEGSLPSARTLFSSSLMAVCPHEVFLPPWKLALPLGSPVAATLLIKLC